MQVVGNQPSLGNSRWFCKVKQPTFHALTDACSARGDKNNRPRISIINNCDHAHLSIILRSHQHLLTSICTTYTFYLLLLINQMADPLSTASGLLTLVVFAFQSTQLLYKAVASFQSNHRIIRELREELEALDGVLESLRETATKTDADFTSLKLPLLRCGKACTDFEAVVVKCTAHSDGPRTSFRDWAKLRYMGDDIVGFKNMLAGYKSTIIIALGDANM